MKRANLWLSALGLIAMSVFAQGALAATCTSVLSGDWQDRIWNSKTCNNQNNNPGGPLAGSGVVISGGTIIKVDKPTTAAVANVTIDPPLLGILGGELRVQGGSTLTLTGDFTNNGTFTAKTGSTVAFTGTNQTIGGSSPITFDNLTVGNNTVLTLAANVTVTGTVKDQNGNPTVPTLASTCPQDFTLTLSATGTVMHSCPVVAPGSFNAFETTTVPAKAITGVIKTKVAGSAFSLDVVAITAGAQENKFTDVVKVELLGNTVTGVALDTVTNCPISSTVIQTVTPAPTITKGRSTVSFAAVADAWKDVRVRVSYPATGTATVVACSTDNFAIRPASLASFVVSDADWTTAGTSRVLGNVTSDAQQGCSNAATPAGCTAATRVIHKAGQPFSVSATAVNAAATPVTTTNYTGTPTALLIACTGTACSATFGTFSVGTAAVGGVIASTNATYSEVGAFSLQLQDQTFASVDAADGSTTAERYFSSAVIDVGRFVPDHFDTAVVATATTPMPCPTGLICPVSFNGFIYSGQPFSVQVVAQDAAGNTTANYDAALGLSRAANMAAWDAPGSVAMQNPGGGAVANGTIAAATFGAGVATTATPTYTFNAASTAPADIFVRAIDADNVSSLRATAASSVEGGVKVVSGRIKISNAYGSELLPLPMTATIQYCSAVAAGNCTWTKSTTDSATSFNTAADIVAQIIDGPLAGGDLKVSGGGAVTVGGGSRTFTFAAPNKTGSANISLGAPAYLSPNAVGRATFGVYKGSDAVIYRGRRGR